MVFTYSDFKIYRRETARAQFRGSLTHQKRFLTARGHRNDCRARVKQ
jgi:hypothetical protein